MCLCIYMCICMYEYRYSKDTFQTTSIQFQSILPRTEFGFYGLYFPLRLCLTSYIKESKIKRLMVLHYFNDGDDDNLTLHLQTISFLFQTTTGEKAILMSTSQMRKIRLRRQVTCSESSNQQVTNLSSQTGSKTYTP